MQTMELKGTSVIYYGIQPDSSESAFVRPWEPTIV